LAQTGEEGLGERAARAAGRLLGMVTVPGSTSVGEGRNGGVSEVGG
jgi:hypothetical protein